MNSPLMFPQFSRFQGFFRLSALALMLSGLVFPAPLYAAPMDSDQDEGTQDGTMQASPSPMAQPTPTSMDKHHSGMMGDKMARDPHMMMEHVEQRIKMLHEKLKITQAQESKWNDIAQVMRDNEAAISRMIMDRHDNAASMTAIDDLQSYQNIMQAHADGLKKMIPVFQALYEEMPEDQQKNADKVFGTFEHHHTGDKHHAKKSM